MIRKDSTKARYSEQMIRMVRAKVLLTEMSKEQPIEMASMTMMEHLTPKEHLIPKEHWMVHLMVVNLRSALQKAYYKEERRHPGQCGRLAPSTLRLRWVLAKHNKCCHPSCNIFFELHPRKDHLCHPSHNLHSHLHPRKWQHQSPVCRLHSHQSKRV